MARLWRIEEGGTKIIPKQGGVRAECPITLELIQNPVLLSDNFVYEEAAIMQWLKENDRAPLTNLTLGHQKILRLAPLQKIVHHFIEESESCERSICKALINKTLEAQECSYNDERCGHPKIALERLNKQILHTEKEVKKLQATIAEARNAASSLSTKIMEAERSSAIKIQAMVRRFQAQQQARYRRKLQRVAQRQNKRNSDRIKSARKSNLTLLQEKQIQLLKDYASKGQAGKCFRSACRRIRAAVASTLWDAEPPAEPLCICRGQLVYMNGKECYLRYCRRLHPGFEVHSEAFRNHARRLMHLAEQDPERRITCDLCGWFVWPSKKQVAWRCDAGYGTDMHRAGYYICGDCFDRHTACPSRQRTRDCDSDLIREYPRLYHVYRHSFLMVLIFLVYTFFRLHLGGTVNHHTRGRGMSYISQEGQGLPDAWRWRQGHRRPGSTAPQMTPLHRETAAVWYFRDLYDGEPVSWMGV